MPGSSAVKWLRGEASWERVAWAAIALGVGIRLVAVLVVHPPYDYIFSDMAGYVGRAGGLAIGEDLPEVYAWYPPGTHLLLAAPFGVFGIEAQGLRAGALLWWALSSATPFFAWRMARRLVSRRAAALTAVLVSFYPLFIFYSGYFSSETPALALLVATLWLGYRASQQQGSAAVVSAIAAGLVGGVALANRPQFILNFAIVGLPMLWSARQRRASWRPAVAFLAAGLLVVSAVVAHQSAVGERLVLLGDYGGLTFYQGHCDVRSVLAGSDATGGIVTSANPVGLELNRGRDFEFPEHEPWDQSFFYGQGLRCVADNGLGHFARLGRNLIDSTAATTPWPLPATGTLGTTAKLTNLIFSLLLPLVLLLAILKWRRDREGGERDLLLHFACAIPVALLYSSEPRHRVLYDVFALALLAVLVVAALDRRSIKTRNASAQRAPAPDGDG